ncbi:unnamed protein product [Closterium sp. NIES-54]
MLAKRAHIGQHKTAKALYDAVLARYSSPATAALGRLILPYLFPELSAFATVKDLVTHLHTSVARYRAALPAEFLNKNPPPMYITLYFIVTHLPDSLRAVWDQFLALDPTDLTVDLLEHHFLAAETSIVAVGAAHGTPRTPFFERGGGGGSGGFGGGSGGGGGGGGSGSSGSGGSLGGADQMGGSGGGQRQQEQHRSETPSPQQLREWFAQRGASGGSVCCAYVVRTGDRAGQTCGKPHSQHRCFSRLDVAWRAEFGDEAERPRWAELLRSGVDIFALHYDAILAAIYALSVSAEGDCYLCVPPDPDIEVAALGASESALPGTAPVEALHTFTLDSGASRYFFRNSTTIRSGSTPLHVSPLVAPDSPFAPHPWLPLPATPSWHALPPPCFWSSQVSASPPALDCPALPSLRRGAAARRSSLLLVSLTIAPLQTLHMDVWGPARVSGQARERYFLLVVDDYTRYTTVFPLRSKGEVPNVLIPWIRAVRLQLRERFHEDLPVLCLHSNRGGEFSSDLLRDFCHREGILQTFTLPASPQRNGIVERRIGLVMEVALTSMIHAAAPHFLWPFAVRYAAHQLNLWPRVSLPETSPTLRWTGRVGDASVFRGPAPSGVSQVDPLPGIVPVKVAVDSGAARGAASGGAPSRGAASGGAEPASVEFGVAEPASAEPGGVEPKGVEPGGAESEGAESGGVEPRDTGSVGGPAAAGAGGSAAGGTGAGLVGATRLGGAGVPSRARGTGGAEGAGPGGTRTRGTGAAGAGSVGGAGAVGAGDGDPGAGGTSAGGAGAGSTGAGDAGARGTGAGGAGAVDPGAGDLGAGGAGAGSAASGGTGDGGTVQRRPFFVPPPPWSLTPPVSDLQQPDSPLPAPSPYAEQRESFIEHHERESRPALPKRAVCTGRRVPCPRPPPVPGTHIMTLCPSSVPLRVPLPPPPESSIPDVPDPDSDLARTASPTVPRLLATVVIDPSFESTAASALGAELVDFAATCRLDYATSLVAESESDCPPFVGGECALGTDVLKDKQENFECLAADVPHIVAMLLAPEGDPLHEEIWLRRPPGFTGSFPAGTQWSLRRPVYGLRQAPRESQDTLRMTLAALGFTPSTADPSLFLRTDTSLPPFYVFVYVDDLVFATADTEALALVNLELQKRHICTDLGPSALRLPVLLATVHSFAYRSLALSSTFGRVRRAKWSISRVVGCLMYLMTCTRPDLAYPLSILARYVAPGRHRPEHWEAAKRVLRNLCSTSGMGLVLGGRARVVLTGHADDSWVDDLATQRSSQGYTFSLGSGSVSWWPTRSSSFLSSSCEAEIYVGAMAAQELRWLTYLLTDLEERPRSSPVLYVDNKAMIALC